MCAVALPFTHALSVTLVLFTVGLAFIAAVVGSAVLIGLGLATPAGVLGRVALQPVAFGRDRHDQIRKFVRSCHPAAAPIGRPPLILVGKTRFPPSPHWCRGSALGSNFFWECFGHALEPARRGLIPPTPGNFVFYIPGVFLSDFLAIICMMEGGAARMRAVAVPCSVSALPK